MKRLLLQLPFVFLLLSLSLPLSAQSYDTAEDLDKTFHTSDIEGETATQANRRTGQRTQAMPEGSYRIGCECMTGEVRSTTGIGSCAGHGGVRYWLVVNTEGDTLQYPTARQALNAENEPQPYIGPNPQTRYSTQPPTIIFMPAQANGLNGLPPPLPPEYRSFQDSLIALFHALPTPSDSTSNRPSKDTVLLGLPLILNSLIQLCIVLVICGTLVLIVRMFMQQPDQPGANSQKIFKKIRLTLIKILFKDNRFLR